MVTEREIDFVFSFPYFNFVKKMQLVIGLWPHQSLYWKIFAKILLYSFLLTFLIPYSNGGRLRCGVDLQLCVENVGGALYTTAVLAKHLTMTLSEKKFMRLYETIAKNWLSVKDPAERAIMVKYAKIGKVLSFAQIVSLIVVSVVYCLLPAVPIVLDAYFPLNQSRPVVVFVHAEFIIEPYDHYVEYYMYYVSGIVVAIWVILSVDTTFCVIVHQFSGLIAVTKYRLQNATKLVEIKKGNSYDIIITAISLHQQLIIYVDLIESSFTVCFLLIIIGSSTILSLLAFVILNSRTHFDMILFIVFNIGVIIHNVILSFNSQTIIDCSDDLFTAMYAAEWYNLSAKSKNLLRIMMLRTSKPLFLTGGGFYVMNMYNFGTIIRTALSYTTVLFSLK